MPQILLGYNYLIITIFPTALHHNQAIKFVLCLRKEDRVSNLECYRTGSVEQLMCMDYPHPLNVPLTNESYQLPWSREHYHFICTHLHKLRLKSCSKYNKSRRTNKTLAAVNNIFYNFRDVLFYCI